VNDLPAIDDAGLRALGGTLALPNGLTFATPAAGANVAFASQWDNYPRDVTMAGAGIDATMLVLGGDLGTRDSLRNFAIRDCTVHTNNHYLFDQRVKPAAVRFERVRVVGFDMGAGASCVFGTAALGPGRRPFWGSGLGTSLHRITW